MKKSLLIIALALLPLAGFAQETTTQKKVHDCKKSLQDLYSIKLIKALEQQGQPGFDASEAEMATRHQAAENSVASYRALRDAGFVICEGLAK